MKKSTFKKPSKNIHTSKPELVVEEQADLLDVVGIGALNVDFIGSKSRLSHVLQNRVSEVCDSFEYGAERPVKEEEIKKLVPIIKTSFDTYFGGSAFLVIQTLAALHLGLKLGYIGVAGNTMTKRGTFADWFERHKEVDATFVHRLEESSGICVSFIDVTQRMLLTWPGANIHFAQLLREERSQILDYISRARIVHVTSLFDESSPAEVARLLADARRRNPSLRVSFDPGYHWCLNPPEAMRDILQISDYVFLKQREFELLGEQQYPLGEEEELISRIFAKCSPRTTLIVLHEYDSATVFYQIHKHLLRIAQRNVIARPKSESIEDATGAGDVFVGGFLSASIFDVMERKHAVELGLRLVASKLRSGGTSSFSGFSQIYDDFIAEITKRDNDQTASVPALSSDSPARVVHDDKSSSSPHKDADDPSDFPHDDEFRFVIWKGKELHFSEHQAKIVKHLYEQWSKKLPVVWTLNTRTKLGFSDTARLDHYFRDDPALGMPPEFKDAFIVKDKDKVGVWRLNLPY